MTVAVRGAVPRGDINSSLNNVEFRLLALERALAGSGAEFTSPTVPSFGGGSVGAPGAGGGVGAGGAPPITDHGLLSGLLDDDHPQYAPRGEQQQGREHVHGEYDVIGLENRFVLRHESVRPVAHVHEAHDVRGIADEHIVRGESVSPATHTHRLVEVADFNLWEMMLWQRIFGG